MSSPQFSVIVPTYNRARLIGKTLRSILDQSFKDFEIIVVDDGSTDDTNAVIESIYDPRLTYYKINNVERGAARNFGTQKSLGRYITFLDSDDVFYKDHLQVANDFLGKNPGVIFAQGFDVRDDMNRIINGFTPINKSVLHHLIHSGNILACMGVFLPSDMAKQNLFHEDRALAGSEDMELWLRISAKHDILYNNRSTAAMVNHENRSVLKVDINALIQRKKLMLDCIFDQEHTKAFYAPYRNKLEANAQSYIALHLTLGGNIPSRRAIPFLIKALKKDPVSFFSKRTFAIIKRLIF